MFFPSRKYQEELSPSDIKSGLVRLQSSHLYIDHEIVSILFMKAHNVNLVYYPKTRTLMIADESDNLFKQLHKAKQHMLKGRNIRGDKSVALHEILIDHDIDTRDRELAYDFKKELGILTVYL